MKNKQITKNYSLFDFIHGATLPRQAILQNNIHLSELHEQNMIDILTVVEKINDEVNLHFNIKTKLVITSGFRCAAWERSRKRALPSRHSRSYAVDIQPAAELKRQLRIDILEFIRKNYNPANKWQGGFAIKPPNEASVGFVHIDLQRPRSRWTY